MVRAPLSSVRRRALAVCLALPLGVASETAARASEGRVVVIDVDPRVADALVVALSPWSLTVVREPGPSPASDVDAAAARARVMAADLHAGAVVWIAPPRPPDQQATLWVYDAQTLELAVRPITVWAPYDEAGAAAVALSVKTVLRASPLITEPPAVDAATRTAHDSERAAPVEPAPPASPSRVAWRVEMLGGGRAPTGSSAAVEPRAALGTSAWPARFGGHAGLGADLQAGSGVSVSTPGFQGELRQGALEVTARLRSPVASWLALELEGGPALVVASLDGHALPAGTALHALRVDPAVDLGAVADVTLGARVTLGAAATGSALLRFQRYALDGAPLLDGPPVVVVFGVRLSVEVD